MRALLERRFVRNCRPSTSALSRTNRVLQSIFPYYLGVCSAILAVSAIDHLPQGKKTSIAETPSAQSNVRSGRRKDECNRSGPAGNAPLGRHTQVVCSHVPKSEASSTRCLSWTPSWGMSELGRSVVYRNARTSLPLPRTRKRRPSTPMRAASTEPHQRPR